MSLDPAPNLKVDCLRDFIAAGQAAPADFVRE
jgi:hypothetical protein